MYNLIAEAGSRVLTASPYLSEAVRESCEHVHLRPHAWR